MGFGSSRPRFQIRACAAVRGMPRPRPTDGVAGLSWGPPPVVGLACATADEGPGDARRAVAAALAARRWTLDAAASRRDRAGTKCRRRSTSAACLTFRRARTVINPSGERGALVTTGPFHCRATRWRRHGDAARRLGGHGRHALGAHRPRGLRCVDHAAGSCPRRVLAAFRRRVRRPPRARAPLALNGAARAAQRATSNTPANSNPAPSSLVSVIDCCGKPSTPKWSTSSDARPSGPRPSTRAPAARRRAAGDGDDRDVERADQPANQAQTAPRRGWPRVGNGACASPAEEQQHAERADAEFTSTAVMARGADRVTEQPFMPVCNFEGRRRRRGGQQVEHGFIGNLRWSRTRARSKPAASKGVASNAEHEPARTRQASGTGRGGSRPRPAGSSCTNSRIVDGEMAWVLSTCQRVASSPSGRAFTWSSRADASARCGRRTKSSNSWRWSRARPARRRTMRGRLGARPRMRGWRNAIRPSSAWSGTSCHPRENSGRARGRARQTRG